MNRVMFWWQVVMIWTSTIDAVIWKTKSPCNSCVPALHPENICFRNQFPEIYIANTSKMVEFHIQSFVISRAQLWSRRLHGKNMLELFSGKIAWQWQEIIQGKKAHKHKQIWRVVLGLDGWQSFVYVFLGSFLVGATKHINGDPQKILKQSRNCFCLCFFFGAFFASKSCFRSCFAIILRKGKGT